MPPLTFQCLLLFSLDRVQGEARAFVKSWRSSYLQGSSVDTVCSSLWTAQHVHSPEKVWVYKLINFAYRCTHSPSSTQVTNQHITPFQPNVLIASIQAYSQIWLWHNTHTNPTDNLCSWVSYRCNVSNPGKCHNGTVLVLLCYVRRLPGCTRHHGQHPRGFFFVGKKKTCWVASVLREYRFWSFRWLSVQFFPSNTNIELCYWLKELNFEIPPCSALRWNSFWLLVFLRGQPDFMRGFCASPYIFGSLSSLSFCLRDTKR